MGCLNRGKNSTLKSCFGLHGRLVTLEQSAHPFQILRRVNARTGRLRRNMNGNAGAMPEGAQLLERFRDLPRCLRQRWELT